MKLLRHILSHLLLIFIMFGIVSLYYYRHLVLPVKYAGKIDGYAEKIHPKLKSFARKKYSEQEAAVVEVASEKAIEMPDENVKHEVTVNESKIVEAAPEQKVAVAEEIKNVQPIAVVEQGVSDVPTAEEPVKKEIMPQAIAEVVATDKPVNEIVAAAPEVVDNAVKTQEAPATDKEAASTNDLLRAARQAFNNGQMDEAITQYNSLIKLDNDEADFFGELGNVHYAMGNWEKAGEAYYEAATRLIEKRQFSQIRYLQRVLKGLDAGRAEKLETKLATINY